MLKSFEDKLVELDSNDNAVQHLLIQICSLVANTFGFTTKYMTLTHQPSKWA